MEENDQIIHTPVMPEYISEYFAEKAGKRALMVDATVGEGGHTEYLLTRFPLLSCICVDADKSMLKRAEKRLDPFGEKVRFFHSWYDQFFLSYGCNEPAPDLILFDFGVSMVHLKDSTRGFSFTGTQKLDMRLNKDERLTAEQVVNTWKREDLVQIIGEYGEERYAGRIAEAIVRNRASEKIKTPKQLAYIISKAVPAQYRHSRIHPATRTFQALRIAVNDELERIKRGLNAALSTLAVGGRIAVISFHSLEDRIVKHTFRHYGKSCICPPEVPMCQCGGVKRLNVLTKKPLRAAEDEKKRNPASRSALLRVAEKLAEIEEQKAV